MRRRLLFAGAVLAWAVPTFIACSSFTGADTPDGSAPGDGGGTEGATLDAPLDQTVDAAIADASNVLMNGNFEFVCSSWSVSTGGSITGTTGRDGGGGCRVCGAGAFSGELYISQIVSWSAISPTTFFARAYVRSNDLDSNPVLTVSAMSLRIGTVDGGVLGTSSGPTLTSEWQEVGGSAVDPGSAGPQMVQIEVGAAFASSDQCFVIDDAYLGTTEPQ